MTPTCESGASNYRPGIGDKPSEIFLRATRCVISTLREGKGRGRRGEEKHLRDRWSVMPSLPMCMCWSLSLCILLLSHVCVFGVSASLSIYLYEFFFASLCFDKLASGSIINHSPVTDRQSACTAVRGPAGALDGAAAVAFSLLYPSTRTPTKRTTKAAINSRKTTRPNQSQRQRPSRLAPEERRGPKRNTTL